MGTKGAFLGEEGGDLGLKGFKLGYLGGGWGGGDDGLKRGDGSGVSCIGLWRGHWMGWEGMGLSKGDGG